ncbi:LOW QUALITY PROTEIN: hypothetical protein HZS_7041 [Henneguya salminicola]|nr:LOW QUALITY PROTEIN: hypothetical protein HZS_7041 [Henneguya salminicola]
MFLLSEVLNPLGDKYGCFRNIHAPQKYILIYWGISLAKKSHHVIVQANFNIFFKDALLISNKILN